LSWKPTDARRWALAGLGLLSAGLGTVGAFVPGLPTTVFVLIAAWAFTRSCPWLEDRILRNPILGPSMEVIDGTRPFTRRARFIAMGTMFLFGFSSIGMLYFTATPRFVLWIILAALGVGAFAIMRFQPRNAKS
jgi:uncharacterized membrane protein YbaN (DUF454 family)